MEEKKEENNNDSLEQMHGPIRERHITDCIFCIIILLFWICCIIIMSYGFNKGNPSLLNQLYDSKGTPCGSKDNGTEAFPFAYFYRPFIDFDSAVCVSTCPTWQSNATKLSQVKCYGQDTSYTEDIGYCQDSLNIDFTAIIDPNATFFNNSFIIYNSSLLLDKICIPSLEGLSQSAQSFFNNMTAVNEATLKANQYIQDVKLSWKLFVCIAIISFLICILYLLFMRWCAGLIIWLSLLSIIILIIGLGLVCHTESRRLEKQELEDEQRGIETLQTFSSRTMFAFAIILYVIGGLCVLIILFCLSSIAIAIAVIKSSALFVASNFFIIFVPVICSGVILGIFILWVVIFVYIYTIGTAKVVIGSPFAEIEWNENVRYLIIFHVFSFLWNAAFFNYLGTFIIAAACSIWYFNYGSEGQGFFSFPILISTWWGFRYHAGSIALAALILAIIYFIQLYLMFIKRQVDSLKEKGIQNNFIDFLIKCLMCYVACFKRVIEFLSQLGICQMALSGQNFCASCLKAFQLIIENPLRFGLVDFIGASIVFIGKVVVASLSGILAWLLLNYSSYFGTGVSSVVVPIILSIIIGYFVSVIFFSVYGVSSDTVILCFFSDKEQEAKGGRPACAPEPMRDFYDNFKKDDQKDQNSDNSKEKAKA